MKFHTRSAITLLPFATSVLSQSSTSFTDPDNAITFQAYTSKSDGVTIGLVFPPTDATGDTATEFVGEIITTVSAGWIGLALGGSMINNPLIVSWLNDGEIVRSTRIATSYALPTVYDGPVITDLPYTTINDTHWKWVFRCQNCTTWASGNLTTDGIAPLAFAYSTVAVETPADSNSSFYEHTDYAIWGEDTSSAHSDDYAAIIAGNFAPI